MNNDDRKYIRLIIRQVHPDLFVNNPFERQQNSESLKNLNSYIDELSKGRSPRSTRLEFFIRDGPTLRQVEAQLGSSGSLAPLFYAFGFISAEELRATCSSQIPNDILGWLRDQVQEAVRTAEKHDVLKWHIRRLRSSLEERFKLSDVQVGAEYAVSLAEQERQVEALKVLEYGMQAATVLVGNSEHFEGVTVQLYHPESCPQETYSYVDEAGNFHMRTSFMKSYIGDDGAVHLVADRHTIKEQLMAIDLQRARLLTQVSFFWLKRVRDLTPAVTQLLGVRSVWCDTKNEQNSQKFVLWAGFLLEKKEQIQALLQGRKYAFSIIVHSDTQGPLLNYHQSSPILNVRADCPPQHLLEFLASEGGEQASLAANEVHNARAKEEALLERVRQTFDAKCVIKICMNDKVIEGAMRLLDNADTIKQAVDLKGACIALDDCYEVWDSGFISIPYNFKIQELSSMVKMLQSGQRPNGEGASAPSGSSNNNTGPSNGSNGNGNGKPSNGNGSSSSSGTPPASSSDRTPMSNGRKGQNSRHRGNRGRSSSSSSSNSVAATSVRQPVTAASCLRQDSSCAGRWPVSLTVERGAWGGHAHVANRPMPAQLHHLPRPAAQATRGLQAREARTALR